MQSTDITVNNQFVLTHVAPVLVSRDASHYLSILRKGVEAHRPTVVSVTSTHKVSKNIASIDRSDICHRSAHDCCPDEDWGWLVTANPRRRHDRVTMMVDAIGDAAAQAWRRFCLHCVFADAK
jgi:alpha-galactosidase